MVNSANGSQTDHGSVLTIEAPTKRIGTLMFSPCRGTFNLYGLVSESEFQFPSERLYSTCALRFGVLYDRRRKACGGSVRRLGFYCPDSLSTRASRLNSA